MSEFVREVGRIGGDGNEGPLIVGVDEDTITIQGPRRRHLTRDQAEDFAQLFVAACWQAGENGRQMAGEVHEAASDG